MLEFFLVIWYSWRLQIWRKVKSAYNLEQWYLTLSPFAICCNSSFKCDERQLVRNIFVMIKNHISLEFYHLQCKVTTERMWLDTTDLEHIQVSKASDVPSLQHRQQPLRKNFTTSTDVNILLYSHYPLFTAVWREIWVFDKRGHTVRKKCVCRQKLLTRSLPHAAYRRPQFFLKCFACWQKYAIWPKTPKKFSKSLKIF